MNVQLFKNDVAYWLRKKFRVQERTVRRLLRSTPERGWRELAKQKADPHTIAEVLAAVGA